MIISSNPHTHTHTHMEQDVLSQSTSPWQWLRQSTLETDSQTDWQATGGVDRSGSTRTQSVYQLKAAWTRQQLPELDWNKGLYRRAGSHLVAGEELPYLLGFTGGYG